MAIPRESERQQEGRICAGVGARTGWFSFSQTEKQQPQGHSSPVFCTQQSLGAVPRTALQAGGIQHTGGVRGRCSLMADTGRGKRRPFVPPCGCWISAGTGGCHPSCSKPRSRNKSAFCLLQAAGTSISHFRAGVCPHPDNLLQAH